VVHGPSRRRRSREALLVEESLRGRIALRAGRVPLAYMTGCTSSRPVLRLYIRVRGVALRAAVLTLGFHGLRRPSWGNLAPRDRGYSKNITTERTTPAKMKARIKTSAAFSPSVHGGGRRRRRRRPPVLLWLRSTRGASGSLRSLGPTVTPSACGPPLRYVGILPLPGH
jgi:hypothetical protein